MGAVVRSIHACIRLSGNGSGGRKHHIDLGIICQISVLPPLFDQFKAEIKTCFGRAVRGLEAGWDPGSDQSWPAAGT